MDKDSVAQESAAFGMHERWIDGGEAGPVLQRMQYVADHVDYCKARAAEGMHGPNKDFRIKASIPAIVVEHYCQISGITLREFLHNKEHSRRIVNDPAFADLRIAPGRM